MTIDFTTYLPDGAKKAMLQDRIQQLATEGLANQIAHTEATITGDTNQQTILANNIDIISAVLTATEAQLTTAP